MEATPEELELRDQAAGDALRRIRADRARASQRLRGLLAYLEEHLFDHSLDVTGWFRACGIRSHSIRVSFLSELELSPLAYLRRHRVHVARRLLIESDLSVWRIAQLVGYKRADAFRDAFRTETGITPLKFRRREGGSRVRTGAPRRSARELAQMRDWRRATLGAAAPELHAQLRDKLLAEYPFLRRYRGGSADRKLEEELAETVYRKLVGYGFEDQKLLVRLQVGFRTTALFDLLRKKSLEEGRLDRRRGVDLAHVALASLDAIAEDLGVDLPNRRAEGLVCLANAYRLADEIDESENVFGLARLELRRAGDCLDPLAEADFYAQKAALRRFQRRYEEAMELVNRAIPVFERHPQPSLITQPLLLRGSIYIYSGSPLLAISDICRGLEQIDEKVQPHLAFAAYTSLTTANRLAGFVRKAEEALEKSFAICHELNSLVARHQLDWLGGLMKHEQGDFEAAEIRLCAAVLGLRITGEMGYAATVSIDLALLYAEQGRTAEVLTVLNETLPLLDGLKLHRESLAALHLLREATETNEASLSILHRIRESLAICQNNLPPQARRKPD